jgi:hypothetical protein
MVSAQYSSRELEILIEKCREERDMDKKIEILYRINSLIPKPFQVALPRFLTDDYIDATLLYNIEQSISSFRNSKKPDIS